MKRYWEPRFVVLGLLTVLIAVIIVVIPLAEHTWFVENKDLLAAAGSAATAFGVLILVPVFWGYFANAAAQRRQLEAQTEQTNMELELERVSLSFQVMSNFYDNESLDEIRRNLRNNEKYELPNGGLRDDEVRMMNFFEAVAIAVEKDVIDAKLLYHLLGCPIWEITQHPVAQRLLEPRYSYEGFVNVLIPKLKPFWEHRGHLRAGTGEE